MVSKKDQVTSPLVDVEAINVVGFLDNSASKTIVIGAHFDHIGRNERNASTLANSHGQIHNGADDNASGVAVVLELARLFKTNEVVEPVNFLFALFSGEEDGLMGSKQLVEQLIQDSLQIHAMINMDMIGRLSNEKHLHVGGVGTSSAFGELIRAVESDFQFIIDSSGVGPSDYTSFYLKNIPVLGFYTGTHEDYHKPSDDADKINFQGIEAITEYLYKLTLHLAQLELDFKETAYKKETSRSKLKVSLGIMPGYSSENGLVIDGVIEGKLAHSAGIQKGDKILKINSCTIQDIHTYMDCLMQYQKGDEVILLLDRNAKQIMQKVKF
jgi:Zn-dependent M28 family amino/carboxypeptidase